MKPLLLYLLQVIICSGIFYGYYHLFLRNKKFHQYNRYFLLIATAGSILVPFLNIPVYFAPQEEQAVWINTLSGISSPDSILFISKKSDGGSVFTLTNILIAMYCFAAIFVFTRFLISLFRIKRIIKNHEVEKIDDINFVNTDEKGTPFSFFNWMFWNKKITLQSEDGQQIFRHELFHIREKHSWDIISMEVLTIIFWVNPFFHIIKKELTTIHEFLADKFAVREEDKWNYAELLLMHLMGTPTLRLTNPFFHNQIKRRIAMITSSQQPKYQYLRKVLVLPLLAMVAFLFAFTYKQKQLEKQEEQAQQNLENLALQFTSPPDTPKVKLQLKGTSVQASKIVIHPGNTDSSFKAAANPKLYIVEGQQYNREQLIAKYGEVIEFNGVVHVTEANNAEAVKKFGEVARNGVIEFKTSESNQQAVVSLRGINSARTDDPMIVINEVVQMPPVNFQSINPNSIESVTILKNEKATSKYGAKAINGVIEIKTKDFEAFQVEGKQITGEVKEVPLDKPKLDEVVVVGYGKTKGKVEGLQIKPSEKLQGVKLEEIKKNNLQLQEVTVQGYATVKDDNKVFSTMEVAPRFNGGKEAWNKYLAKNLSPLVPVDNGAPEGTYTVDVQFIVDMEGNLSSFKALTNHGYGMEEEVIRILKAGPKWLPGEQNGHKVKAYAKQPVTFVISSEADDEKSLAPAALEKSLENIAAIYPNPAGNSITIPYSAQASGSGEIRVRDMSGKTFMTQKANLNKGANNLTLNVSSLAQGTYLISVSEGSQQAARTYKMVKQ